MASIAIAMPVVLSSHSGPLFNPKSLLHPSTYSLSLFPNSSPTLNLNSPGDSDCEESPCNVGDLDLIPGLGRSPGEENGYPFQYSCLENSKDRGAWQVTVHGVTKSQTRLSDFLFFSDANSNYMLRKGTPERHSH